MESESEQPAADEVDENVDDQVEETESGPPRFPQFGTYEGLAPAHLSPFAIETNVSRIAQQIAQGRPATMD